MSVELGEVLTVAELARRVGWSPARMRRALIALDEANGGALLINISRGKERPRFCVAVAKLRELSPEWFGRSDPESTERQIEWLTEQLDELRGELSFLAKRIDMQTERIISLAKERRC